jgi:hypothetical protein
MSRAGIVACVRRSVAVQAIAISLTAASMSVAAEVIDRVVAIVGNQLILASDVSAARTFGLVGVGDAPDEESAALSRLVDRALILAEVNRYAPPEPDDAAVAAQVDALRARFADPDSYRAALLRVGLEEAHLREWLRQDLRMLAYLDQRFVVTPPTDEEVAAAYQRGAAWSDRGGSPIALEDAAPVIVRSIVAERRAARVEEWLIGLRRRTQVVSPP